MDSLQESKTLKAALNVLRTAPASDAETVRLFLRKIPLLYHYLLYLSPFPLLKNFIWLEFIKPPRTLVSESRCPRRAHTARPSSLANGNGRRHTLHFLLLES